MKKTLHLFIGIWLMSNLAYSQQTPCDTITLTNGHILIATVLQQYNDEVLVEYCHEDKKSILLSSSIVSIKKQSILPAVNHKKLERQQQREDKQTNRQMERAKKFAQQKLDAEQKQINKQKAKEQAKEARRQRILAMPSQAEKAPDVQWRFGMETGLMFSGGNKVKKNLINQGFGDRYYSEAWGWFETDKNQKNPKSNTYPISFYVDVKTRKQLFVGIHWTSSIKIIRGFNYFYTTTFAAQSFPFPSSTTFIGHHLNFQIDCHSLKPKIEWTSSDHRYAFYGGPSINFIHLLRHYHKTKLGFWLGTSLNHYFRSKKHFYAKVLIEYHFIPSIPLPEESKYEERWNGDTYESHFQGIDLPLSYLRIGFGVGWLF